MFLKGIKLCSLATLETMSSLFLENQVACQNLFMNTKECKHIGKCAEVLEAAQLYECRSLANPGASPERYPSTADPGGVIYIDRGFCYLTFSFSSSIVSEFRHVFIWLV